jgi:hypothetical protein
MPRSLAMTASGTSRQAQLSVLFNWFVGPGRCVGSDGAGMYLLSPVPCQVGLSSYQLKALDEPVDKHSYAVADVAIGWID